MTRKRNGKQKAAAQQNNTKQPEPKEEGLGWRLDDMYIVEPGKFNPIRTSQSHRLLAWLTLC